MGPSLSTCSENPLTNTIVTLSQSHCPFRHPYQVQLLPKAHWQPLPMLPRPFPGFVPFQVQSSQKARWHQAQQLPKALWQPLPKLPWPSQAQRWTKAHWQPWPKRQWSLQRLRLHRYPSPVPTGFGPTILVSQHCRRPCCWTLVYPSRICVCVIAANPALPIPHYSHTLPLPSWPHFGPQVHQPTCPQRNGPKPNAKQRPNGVPTRAPMSISSSCERSFLTWYGQANGLSCHTDPCATSRTCGSHPLALSLNETDAPAPLWTIPFRK
jgi:hypothetical protein